MNNDGRIAAPGALPHLPGPQDAEPLHGEGGGPGGHQQEPQTHPVQVPQEPQPNNVLPFPPSPCLLLVR